MVQIVAKFVRMEKKNTENDAITINPLFSVSARAHYYIFGKLNGNAVSTFLVSVHINLCVCAPILICQITCTVSFIIFCIKVNVNRILFLLFFGIIIYVTFKCCSTMRQIIGMCNITKMQLTTITDVNGNCSKIFNKRRCNNNKIFCRRTKKKSNKNSKQRRTVYHTLANRAHPIKCSEHDDVFDFKRKVKKSVSFPQ